MRTNNKQVVILGAGYAGMMAALRLAHQIPKSTTITLINPYDTFQERIRFHQLAAGNTSKQFKIRRMIHRLPIEFLQASVLKIQPEHNSLVIHERGASRTLGYDYLVYALGSKTDLNVIPGARIFAYPLDWGYIRSLQTKIARHKHERKKLLVIGQGLTGIEAATEFAETYPNLQVHLVASGNLGEQFSQKGDDYLRKVFQQFNIQVSENTSIQKIYRTVAETTTRERIPYDWCIWAGGFVALPFAQEADIATNAKGQVKVDHFLRSVSHPNIFAVGDAAALPKDMQPQIRMGCVTALPLGAHGADNLAATLQGKNLSPFRFKYMLQCISLGQKAALAQYTTYEDQPTERILTGRQGALMKSFILRYTVQSLFLSRRLKKGFFWAKTKHDIENNIAKMQHELV